MARKPHEPLPESIGDLGGLTKAAIMVLAIGRDDAAGLLRKMEYEEVEELSRELASLGSVTSDLRNGVVREFYDQTLASKFVGEGNLDFAKTLLQNSMDPTQAERMVAQIQTQVQKSPFSFLQRAESDSLLTFIQDEHPQTIALVVCHLPHHKAAEVIVGLPMKKQLEVIKRIANMDQTNPEVIREVEQGLEQRLSNMLSQSMEKAGGVETVAEILNLADRSSEKTIMEGLEVDDPDLVESIRRLMFVFEDVKLVNDKGIQNVLKEIDNNELAVALKTASEDLKKKIFSNMSERAAQLIQEEMEFMGPVRVSDVESAQQRIVDVVRRLEESGDVMIQGRGTDDMIV
ncbi:MAG: flagellar motor switch protein FliG [Phycisphaeraceae bacterium]|nr:flagellar motor switch protein FliG [Phycisphaerales bacterium]MCB9860537.1 flagellar motor switch protein FliG [Phycisphaeraceae bacterium]